MQSLTLRLSIAACDRVWAPCRNVFCNKFRELEESLFKGNRDIFSEKSFTEENFLRAAVAVRARVHEPLDNDKIALVPIADQVRGHETKLYPHRECTSFGNQSLQLIWPSMSSP